MESKRNSTILEVPPEIVDRTIDYLHDDKGSLKSCSLVSRTWHNTSRFHLFRTIHVKARLNDNKRPFAHFLRFFDTAPDAALHIRTIQIEPGVDYKTCAIFCMHDLHDILQLSHSPQLLKLKLCSLDLQACHEEHCKDLPFRFSPVPLHALSFGQDCGVDNLTSLSQILDLFSTITYLDVNDLVCYQSIGLQATMEQGYQFSLNVQCTKVVAGTLIVGKIFPLLRHSRSINTISSISAEVLDRLSLDALVDFISVCGLRLETLSLNLRMVSSRERPTSKSPPLPQDLL